MLEPSEEKAIIARAQKGDMTAFRALYDAHLRRVISQVGRIMGPGPEVEDVVQNVFIQVHRSLPSFKGDSKFSTWLYRVTWNVTVSHMRRRVPMVDLPALRQFAVSDEMWSHLEARERLRTLHAGIADLPRDYREAFVLFEIEGKSLKEISELTGESINTIASRVRRSRERLRALLERAGLNSEQRSGGTKS
jgi:RNA polymerase sigma-70 factor (ECF subfamily)